MTKIHRDSTKNSKIKSTSNLIVGKLDNIKITSNQFLQVTSYDKTNL